MRALALLLTIAVLGGAAVAVAATQSASAPRDAATTTSTTPAPGTEAPAPRRSRALGRPWDGRLVDGVQLPAEGPEFATWDDVRAQSPNRPGRRWGTDTLVRLIERVAAEYRAAHPDAPPLLVGDLSRPRGGPFGEAYGGLGHASHQNGLDADIYYPRRDRVPRGAWRPSQVDRALAQDLVDRFVAAGAQRVFVGPRVGLRGPRRIVQVLTHHDDHLHVRIHNPRPLP